MERNTSKRETYSSAIIQPRFPHLKPKPYEEIIQYKVGRKRIIDAINMLEQKFEHYLEPMIKPVININTEPFEIFTWYTDAIESILNNLNFQDNMLDFLKGTDKEYYVSSQSDPDEHFGIPVNWINQAPKKYQKWLRYILFHFFEFGCFDVWTYAEWYSYELEVMSDDLQLTESEEEKKEIQKRIDEYNMGLDELESMHPTVEKERPKRLLKPKTEIEEIIYKAIQAGIDFIDAYSNANVTIDHFECQDHSENGYLPLSHLFMIMDGWRHTCSHTEWYICEQGIDIQANQVGICSFEIKSLNEKELCVDDFDFTVINKLIQCVWTWREAENKIYG